MRTVSTHPVAPAAVLCVTALTVVLWTVAGQAPVALSWMVLALAAGYAVSGSV